ncbi:HlyD family efflux transporter periplasmic adaptor subunit [Aureliella helgolandensis]|uniref:Efflux system component YknX n=1 Tax=Aureliella helgolandensis TaxID=2527968 RepID=A0A518G1Y1_9BACT|nr:HlyD family efflux transporter periplasmic adaptor subunit [Aureliella helgolandensis]QDV22608.1 Putative efflux system component YknX [Aureliella helgolandensis]
MKPLFRILLSLLLLAGVSYGIYRARGFFGNALAENNEAATYTVQRRTLEDRVVERGTVESQHTVYGRCEVPRGGKITFIVPEGTPVEEGDEVVKFQTDEVEADIREKDVQINEAKGKQDEAIQALEIQRNKNATDEAAAKLEYEIAAIDLKKYEKGDFVAEVADLERAIKEAEAELEKVRDEKNNIEILVKKGYRTPQQLREYQLRENTYQFQVERDKQKLRVLVTYEREKKLIELRGKEEETRLKLERAKQTADAEEKKAEGAVSNAENGVKILEQQMQDLIALKEKCTLKAEQNGIVVYANESWYDDSRRIREGTEVWSGRSVYYLPDMKNMQVKANVHESVVDRIKPDQKANIRLDAFNDVKLTGTISKVAGMAASSHSAVQNYETIILIDELPEGLSIKPGMTAEVDILVGTYTDVIAVPVGAITEHFSQSYVYVLNGSNAGRRIVKTGRVTHSFIEITDGLEVGETVALDAYQRGIADFADAEREAGGSSSAAPAEPPGA